MQLGRTFLCLCGVYVFMLATIVLSGILKYGHLKDVVPEQGLNVPPGALQWYSAYGGFLEISVTLLALLIGVSAALYGLVKKSPLEGLGLLIISVGLTYLVFSLLPHYYYSGGDIGPGLYWITRGIYDYSGAWFFTTFFGFIIKRKIRRSSSSTR